MPTQHDLVPRAARRSTLPSITSSAETKRCAIVRAACAATRCRRPAIVRAHARRGACRAGPPRAGASRDARVAPPRAASPRRARARARPARGAPSARLPHHLAFRAPAFDQPAACGGGIEHRRRCRCGPAQRVDVRQRRSAGTTIGGARGGAEEARVAAVARPRCRAPRGGRDRLARAPGRWTAAPSSARRQLGRQHRQLGGDRAGREAVRLGKEDVEADRRRVRARRCARTSSATRVRGHGHWP